MRPGELMERMVGASAGIIAVAALGTAVYTAWITRQQQKMSVWPYVTQANSDSGGVYNRLVRNAGVGPALIRSFELQVDGKRAESWAEARHRAGMATPLHGSLHSDLGPGWVIMPGQTLSVLSLPDTTDQRLFRALVVPHLHTVVCYCSVYGDCWRDDSEESEPREATCPRSP